MLEFVFFLLCVALLSIFRVGVLRPHGTKVRKLEVKPPGGGVLRPHGTKVRKLEVKPPSAPNVGQSRSYRVFLLRVWVMTLLLSYL